MKRGAAFALPVLAICAGAGCSILFDPDHRAGGRDRDGGTDIPDADPDRPDATHRCSDWGARRVFDPCELPEPGGEVLLGGTGTWTFDTRDRSLRYDSDDGAAVPSLISAEIDQLEGGRRAVVISADRFDLQISATLRVVGPLPLIIASWSDLNISGTLDVSSHALQGPGANEPDGQGAFAVDFGSGGGGGGFGQPGGGGGSSPPDVSGPAGGVAIAVGNQLRGGCSGGLGDNSGISGEAVGDGGGAILLSAISNVAIGTALVTASGEAGDGGQSMRGGSGGGSGGMIALEGPTIRILSAARIEALGGGAGGGGGNGGVVGDGGIAGGGDGGRGTDGYEPDATMTPGTGGQGGIGLQSGGSGGNGSGTASAGQNGEDANAGAGGGGGGPGMIVLWGTPTIIGGSMVRPPPLINP